MERQNITFFTPAYNCAETIRETIESIFNQNFLNGDEYIIVNDGSTDNTNRILQDLKIEFPQIRIIEHKFNKGGGAARNTAVEASKNEILFCLDADNILLKNSIRPLVAYLKENNLDVAAFGEAKCFNKNDKNNIIRTYTYIKGPYTIKDFFSGVVEPASSGNYLFTKESWIKAGMYPVGNFLDTWGFGTKQLLTGSKIMSLPNSYYLHRQGIDSYWVREDKKGITSILATQILIPFFNLIEPSSLEYMLGEDGRDRWYRNLKEKPIKFRKKPSEDPFGIYDFSLKNRVSKKIRLILSKLSQRLYF